MKIQFSKLFTKIITLVTFLIACGGMYYLGTINGYTVGKMQSQENVIGQDNSSITPSPTIQISPTGFSENKIADLENIEVVWSGAELWDEVNKRREELGISPLGSRDELCTISSVRLNELLELNALDAHKGFSEMKHNRPDLNWVFDKYSVVAEYLAVGGKTPNETTHLWESDLVNNKLITGGEYVWGCIYAQNTLSVAIVAY